MGQPARVAQVTPKYDHKQPAKIVEGGEKDGNTTRLDNPQQREDHQNHWNLHKGGATELRSWQYVVKSRL
ncbi:hypothetical protein TMEN_2685 [Trichophyton mentagrophytes]|nr:hypothetical protein TMEN_2685 [Trichophyton mentagrophytes]